MSDKGYKISKESIDKVFSQPNIDILGYEPPIQIMLGQMRMEQENGIYKVIQEQGIAVDKDELIKALRYDREQYDKGYVKGYNAGLTADKWISVDERLPDNHRAVLAVCKSTSISGGAIRAVGSYGGGCWFLADADGTLRLTKYMQFIVTHWMELPEFPKKSEE